MTEGGSAVDPRVVRDRWNVDPDQARIPVGQKSIDERKGSRVGAAHRRSSQRTFGSLDRRAHQTMGERQMNEGFEQFLATIIEQCLDEHDIQAPLVVRTVGNNGSVLVVGINEGAELVVLTKHGENDTFTLPMK